MVIGVSEGFLSIPEKISDIQIDFLVDDQDAAYFDLQFEVAMTLCFLYLQKTAPLSIKTKIIQ